jgi:hypothetical protein
MEFDELTARDSWFFTPSGDDFGDGFFEGKLAARPLWSVRALDLVSMCHSCVGDLTTAVPWTDEGQVPLTLAGKCPLFCTVHVHR